MSGPAITLVALWLGGAFQVAPAPVDAPTPAKAHADGGQSWSILTCQNRERAGEIVVCGRKDADVYDEGPAGRGANRDRSGANALALQQTPCRARQGCDVLYAPSAVSKVPGLLAGAVRSVAAKRPDTRGRVAIPLDEPAQPAAGATR